jgi:hypothetical protein
MKHVKLFGELINESVDRGGYAFIRYQVEVNGTPAKGETKYAVIEDNSIDFEGTTLYLKSGMNSRPASFEIEVLSFHDTEEEAAAAYADVVKRKVGTRPHYISFGYGTMEAKGSNLYFTQIEGIRTKLSR